MSTLTRPVEADSPGDFDEQSWKQIARRTWKRMRDDNLALIASGVAFWGLLALFPALIAVATVYGLFASPNAVQSMVESVLGTVSPQMREVVSSQLQSVVQSSGGLLSFGLIASLAGLLWSASSGASHLLQGLSIAFQTEDRKFLQRRGYALLLALVGTVLGAVAVGVIAFLPVTLRSQQSGALGTTLQVVSWLVAGAIVAGALTLLYRYGPNRPPLDWTWASWGAAGAAAAWLIASILFSAYVTNFGNYANVYGFIGGVIILMLWLYLTSFVVLLGGLADHEMARQAGKVPVLGEPVM